MNPNAGFRRQLEVFERQLQMGKAAEVPAAVDAGSEEQEWRMGGEIVRWHPRERRLEVVQGHVGDWKGRTRGWLRHVGTHVWAYHFRRAGKAIQQMVRSWYSPQTKIE